MTRKHWIATNLQNQAHEEDPKTAERMLKAAEHLRKCGSTTIWDVAMRGYNARIRKGKVSKKPEIEEYVEWRGDQLESGKLATLGLARCNRAGCPICNYARNLFRRDLALKWAKERDWEDYYGVLLTFTVSHKLSESETTERFKKVLDKLNTSLIRFGTWFRSLSKVGGRGYRSSAPDSLGYIASLEITFGNNGLHPHFHVMFLTKCEEDVERLREWFRKDRVRIWKESSSKLQRMPDKNEELSFDVFFYPGIDLPIEKMIQYISKGIYETLSGATKDEQKIETSKSVFQLSGHELKYFCTFFEATKGKRFFRSGGICSDITIEKETEDKKIEDNFRSTFEPILKISSGEEGWVTEFFSFFRRELEEIIPQLSGEKIREMIVPKWNAFKLKKAKEGIKAFERIVEEVEKSSGFGG